MISPVEMDQLAVLAAADGIGKWPGFIVGDAIATMEKLRPESVGLIVTSPPYNLGKDYGDVSDEATYMEYLDWSVEWTNAAYELLEPGGRLCINLPLDINLQFDVDGKKHSTKTPMLYDVEHFVSLFGDQEWVYNTTILWLEGNVSRRTAWGSWLSASDPWINTAAEVVLVLSKGQRKRERKGTSTITREEFMDWTLGLWSFSGESAKRIGHPAPFPEELPRRLIRLFSFKEDLVLDPFTGSGTTNLVAMKEGRRSIGIDSNPEFIALAERRVEAARARD